MSTVATWPSQAETFLDERGKPAWIIAMVIGFILFWPVGLAILLYMTWSKRMFNGNCGHKRHSRRHMGHPMGRHKHPGTYHSSGNAAFDAYKEDTLRRPEEEQGNFEAFLERLRDAKDKSEFDQFMDERATKSKDLSEPIEV